MTQSQGAGAAIIVGAGLMGRWHAHAVERGGGTVTAIVDLDRDRAMRLQQRHSQATCFTDLGDALTAVESSVVHLCTPAGSHALLAQRALGARRHVLIEKPFARTLAETDDLLAAAHANNRLACPVHQFPFQRGVLAARALIVSIGPVRHLELTICSAGAEGEPAARDAVAAEILPHLLSLVAAFSPTVRLPAGSWTCLRPALGELIVVATLGDLGVTGRISMRGRPAMNELRLVGERGTVAVDLFHGFAVTDRAGSSRAPKVLRPFRTAARQGSAAALNLARRIIHREPAYPGLRELIHRFHHAARTGAPSPIPPEETRDIMNVWLALLS